MKHGNGDQPQKAKSALADYYDDLLGSLSGSPLEEKIEEEAAREEAAMAEAAAEAAKKEAERLAAQEARERAAREKEAREKEARKAEEIKAAAKLAAEKRKAQALAARQRVDKEGDENRNGDVSASSSGHPMQFEADERFESTNNLTLTPEKPYTGPERRRSMLAATRRTDFTQAPTQTRPLSDSPIIPAAFPKLAPQTIPEAIEPKTETPEPAPRVETVEKTVTQVQETPGVELPVAEAQPQSRTSTPSAPSQKLAEPEVPEQTLSESASAQLSETALSENHRVGEPQPWLDNGRPAWAQDRFECLLFTVAGLKLAVPLISLGAIHKLDEDLTPLVGRAEWFMGLFRSGDRNIQVVDTARWVMPDRYSEEIKDRYKFVIRLGDTNWGMACDTVEQAIQLLPEQVKWRSERSKRPWLSGTVIDHMCALLDADTLSYLLQNDAEQKRRH